MSTIFLVSVCMAPCSPNIILFSSFGCLMLTNIQSIFQALADSFALSSFSFSMLFRELLRNRNSSLALFLFSIVTLFGGDPFIVLFAFFSFFFCYFNGIFFVVFFDFIPFSLWILPTASELCYFLHAFT